MDTPDITIPTRRRRVRWWGVALGLLGLIALDALIYPRLPMGGQSGNTGRNGLWIRHTWYFGERSDDDMRRLARQLRAHGIRDVYAHVRFIRPDGRLRFRRPATARRFTDALHRAAPGARIFAWVYVGSAWGTPTVEVGDPAIRRRMLAEARWLIETCGYDGIQWDYEVIRSWDPHLLTLLRETRAALPPGTPVSVCTAPWYPAPVTRWYGWDPAISPPWPAHAIRSP